MLVRCLYPVDTFVSGEHTITQEGTEIPDGDWDAVSKEAEANHVELAQGEAPAVTEPLPDLVDATMPPAADPPADPATPTT